MMFGPYGCGPGWGWMVGGWIMMIVLWGLVIVGVVALIRMASGSHSAPDTPLEILRRRYARGELTKEQFEEMKRNVA